MIASTRKALLVAGLAVIAALASGCSSYPYGFSKKEWDAMPRYQQTALIKEEAKWLHKRDAESARYGTVLDQVLRDEGASRSRSHDSR